MKAELIRKETGVEVTGSDISFSEKNVAVKFNIDGKKETGEIYYKVGQKELSVVYHPENGAGTAREVFTYDRNLTFGDVNEAVEFGHKYLKENL